MGKSARSPTMLRVSDRGRPPCAAVIDGARNRTRTSGVSAERRGSAGAGVAWAPRRLPARACRMVARSTQVRAGSVRVVPSTTSENPNVAVPVLEAAAAGLVPGAQAGLNK
jgi:hypothetical protein